MKLQGHVSKKIKNKKYIKYVIVIPPNIIKRLGWKVGMNLNLDIEDQKVVIS